MLSSMKEVFVCGASLTDCACRALRSFLAASSCHVQFSRLSGSPFGSLHPVLLTKRRPRDRRLNVPMGSPCFSFRLSRFSGSVAFCSQCQAGQFFFVADHGARFIGSRSVFFPLAMSAGLVICISCSPMKISSFLGSSSTYQSVRLSVHTTTEHVYGSHASGVNRLNEGVFVCPICELLGDCRKLDKRRGGFETHSAVCFFLDLLVL